MNIALLLTINAVFGCLVLVIGFAAGIWLSKTNHGPAKIAPVAPTTDVDLDTALQHAHMAYSSLLRVANGVSNNIAAHSTKVAAISNDLRAIDLSLPDANQLILAAPERLLAVNLELQQQLLVAKQQIESQSALLRTSESEARTDALTGLLNRRAFDEEIRKQFGAWQRKNIRFALLLLDIDRFKHINDTQGHMGGDDVLRAVAERIVGQLREMDSAFRYGGEEFAVLLPATEIKAATIVGERIRRDIEAAILPCGGKPLKATISIGASKIVAGDEVSRMIQRADDALYGAKQAGRNCLRWHDGTRVLAADSNKSDHSTTVNKPSSAQPRTTQECAAKTSLNRELTKQICQSRRVNQPLSIVCTKIDIQESPQEGKTTEVCSEVLPAVMAIARKQLPKDCFAAPLAASEFVVVLPGHGHDTASQWAGNTLTQTSIGELPCGDRIDLRWEVCELHPFETAEQLLTRAQESLIADLLATT